MKSRHFSLAKLLKQLQSEDVVIVLNEKEMQLPIEEQRKLREQKLQQLPGAIQASIQMHGGSRIFELPNEIDSLFADAEADSKALLSCLLNTPIDEIEIDEGIPRLAATSMTRTIIQRWAKEIMRHAAYELLTTDNEIRPVLKKHFINAPGSLTSADLILSFFTYNSMHISKLLQPYRVLEDAEPEVNEHLYNIFIAYDDCVKDASIWSEQVLEERKPGSKQNKTSGRTSESHSRKNSDPLLTREEKIGIGIGAMAALVITGIFGVAFALSSNNKSPGPRPPGNH